MPRRSSEKVSTWVYCLSSIIACFPRHQLSRSVRCLVINMPWICFIISCVETGEEEVDVDYEGESEEEEDGEEELEGEDADQVCVCVCVFILFIETMHACDCLLTLFNVLRIRKWKKRRRKMRRTKKSTMWSTLRYLLNFKLVAELCCHFHQPTLSGSFLVHSCHDHFRVISSTLPFLCC